MARVVHAPMLEAGSLDGRRPLPIAELLELDVPAARRREQDRRVDIRCGIASSASSTTFRSGTAPTEPSVFPPSFKTPPLYRRRTWTTPASARAASASGS